jgi:hypothetical protein
MLLNGFGYFVDSIFKLSNLVHPHKRVDTLVDRMNRPQSYFGIFAVEQLFGYLPGF